MIKKGIVERYEKNKNKEIELKDINFKIEQGDIKDLETKMSDIDNTHNESNNGELTPNNQETVSVDTTENNNSSNSKNRICGKLCKSINYNIQTDIDKNKNVKLIHDNAEKFDEKTEESFKGLQIFTAICDSFSHGANDVANAIGPFAAIYTIYETGTVSEDSELGSDGYWILAIGGAGIMLGLAVYGYKIIRAIGVKLCTITPSRGVSIELSSSTIIIIGSRLGIPLSTTHCQIGATMGVAALEDLKKCSGLNGGIVLKTIIGWIITLLVVGLTAALLTSFSVYAPSMGTILLNNTDGNVTCMEI
jgi:sodium-dependent phosphate transporter